MTRLQEIFKTLIDGHDPECTLDTRQCLELFDEGLILAEQLHKNLLKFPISKQQELEIKVLELQTKLHQMSGEAVEMSIESYIQGYEDAAQVLVATSKTHNKEKMMKALHDKIQERRK